MSNKEKNSKKNSNKLRSKNTGHRHRKNTVTIKACAKINLSLDVGAVMTNGYHNVDMIMHQLRFHDDVTVTFTEKKHSKRIKISLTTSRPYLPTDSRNLAYQAAELMIARYGDHLPYGDVHIDIVKRIPVSAGLAGGSSNAAAVIHAFNTLFNLKLPLSELMKNGAELGADVPFCVMAQPRYNSKKIPNYIRRDQSCGSCARARGTGTKLETLPPIKQYILFAKPNISVSTAKAYKALDSCEIPERPDNNKFSSDLKSNNPKMNENFINVFENYTLNHHSSVLELKKRMCRLSSGVVLMSGTGPTIFSIYDNFNKMKKDCQKLRNYGYEAYWTMTTV